LPDGPLADATLETIRDAFHKVYAQRYAEVPKAARFEGLNFRVRCSAPDPQVRISGAVGGAANKVKGSRNAWFDGRFQDVTVWDRYALVPGDEIDGPAIVEEREATTVIAAGDRITIDASLNLRLAVHVPDAPSARITTETPLAAAMELI